MTALIKNLFWGGLSTVLNMVAGIVAILVGIRLVGSDGFGYITLLLSFSLLFLAINKGMNTILVRQLQESYQHSDGQAASLLGAGALYTLFSVLLLILCVLAVGDSFVKGIIYFGEDVLLEKQIVTVLYLLTVATLLELFSMLASSALEGLGRFDLVAQCDAIYSISLLVGMCWLLLWGGEEPMLTTVVSLYLLASLMRFLTTQYAWLKWAGFDGLRPGNIISGLDKLKPLCREGIKIQGAGILTLFVDPLNKMLLNFFVGPAAVTHYDLAVRAATSVQNVFSQGFRSFMALPVDKEGQSTVAIYLKLLGPSLGIASLMYIVAGVCLVLIKGMGLVEFGDNVIYLYWVIIPSGLAIVAILPLYHVLIRRGDLNYIFRLTALLAVCNILFSALSIPLLGLIGAGVGIVVATLANCVSVFRRYSMSVEPIQNVVSILGQRYLSLGVAVVLMVMIPAVILQLFVWSKVIAFSVAMAVILLAGGLICFEARSIWRQKDEFA